MARSTLVAILFSGLAHAQIPDRLGYQGRLLKADGAPINDIASVRFTLFSAPQNGTALWEEVQTVGVTDGFYSTFLGAADGGATLSAALASGAVWLEIAVKRSTESSFETLAPRQQIGSVAYALHARNVAGGVVTASSVSVSGPVSATGAISAGGALTVNGTVSVNGVIVINADGGLAAVQSPVAGPGIAIGTGSHAISLDSSGCVTGQVLQWTGSAWVCVTPVTQVTVDAPLQATTGATPHLSLRVGVDAGTVAAGDDARFRQLGGVAVSTSTPSTSDVLTYNGTAWAPAAAPTGTWCGLAFVNAGTHASVFPGGSFGPTTAFSNGNYPASGAINCRGVSPASSCPSGYVQFCWSFVSFNAVDNVADTVCTCVKN